MSVAAVVLAGGSGTRLGADRNTVLLPLGGEPLLARSLRRAVELPDVSYSVNLTKPAPAPAPAG